MKHIAKNVLIVTAGKCKKNKKGDKKIKIIK